MANGKAMIVHLIVGLIKNISLNKCDSIDCNSTECNSTDCDSIECNFIDCDSIV